MNLHVLLVLLSALSLSVKAQRFDDGQMMPIDVMPIDAFYGRGVCHLGGDPHYTSFDHLHFDWQGTCRYNLASYCGCSRSPPSFQIISKNEHRNGDMTVSWALYVEIHFGGDTVVLGSNPFLITVNGVTYSLPYTGGSYLVVHSPFGYAVFTATIAPLIVAFDGISSVYVVVGNIYASRLCGLCGNFDDNSANDWQMSDGSMASSGWQLGNSWTVPDPRCRWPKDVPLELRPVDQRVTDRCNVLGDVDGVLGPLVRNTDEKEVALNIQNCLLDAGYSKGASVNYTLRHFAVVGNEEHADCAECQVDLATVLSDFGFGCNGKICA